MVQSRLTIPSTQQNHLLLPASTFQVEDEHLIFLGHIANPELWIAR